jgi:hypothetical protein
MVGKVVFWQVETLRSKGELSVPLQSGAVFDLHPARGPSSSGDDAWRRFEFIADAPVLEVVAASYELLAYHEESGCSRIFAFWERELERRGAVVWTRALDSLSAGYRGSVSIQWIDAQWPQAGFAGILGNATRRVLDHAIACYDRLGQARMSQILKSALIVSGAENPTLWQRPPSSDDFGGLEPLSDDLDELDALYGDERARVPVAGEWDESDPGMYGTIEHYWRTYPEDFHPAPD